MLMNNVVKIRFSSLFGFFIKITQNNRVGMDVIIQAVGTFL